MIIGYSQDILGQATVKYAVIEELRRGRFLVRRLSEVLRPDGSKYLAYGNLEIVSELKNVKEEDKDGND